MNQATKLSGVWRLKEHELFRAALGIYLLWYYVLLLPNFFELFGPSQMVDRTLLRSFVPSLLAISDSRLFFAGCAVTLLALIIAFLLGRLNSLGVLMLFVLQVSFHNANPLIIHEPQQISNLYLFAFLFLLPSQSGRKADRFVLLALQSFIAIYYVAAGAKKLPDPYWYNGDALRHLLAWPGLRRATVVNLFIVDHMTLARFLNYFTLFFEIAAPIGIFVLRFRPYWILTGIVFHFFIFLTMEVGTFSSLMVMSYACLLDQSTLATFSRWFSFRKKHV